MPTEERNNRVFKSLHVPLLIFGIESRMFQAIFAIGYVIYFAIDRMVPTLALCVVLSIAARFMTKKDPVFFAILSQALSLDKTLRFRAVYDPAKYQDPHVEIH